MHNAVNWFEIYTDDFSRAKRFYTEVFQCTLTDMHMHSPRHAHMDYALFPGGAEDGSGAGGALVWLKEVKPGGGGTLVYFATQEIHAELSRVEAAGGKVLRSKTAIGEAGFIALVEDTEGNVIGLRSQR